MERAALESMLAEGLSIDAIAARVERAPSTVSYWLSRHGLRANGALRYGAQRALDPAVLAELVAKGLTVPAIAVAVERSPAVVRRALTKHGLVIRTTANRVAAASAAAAGLRKVDLVCAHHGLTAHLLEGRRGYRCLLCRSESVSRHRRRLKRRLVDEAGGSCWNCGYGRCPAALQFHHVNPRAKSFSLADTGITRSYERARHEAAKCILLCATCHAEVEVGYAQVAATRATPVS